MMKNQRLRLGNSKQKELTGILFLLPTIILMLCFKYVPIAMGAFISFFDLDIVNMPGEFVGLKNYIRAFTDVRFYESLWHNVKMMLYSTVMTFWCPIFLAILVNEIRGKAKTFYRIMFFIPAVTPGIASTILWKYIWNPDYGLMNQLTGLFGMAPQMWLNSPTLVYFCMYFPGMLICGGMTMVIFLAALQNIPQEQYEAAVMDGAGILRRVRHITIPHLSGTIVTMYLLGMIGTFNALDNVMVLTGGGPAGSTETVLLYAYQQATNSMDYSYAVTMATIVFLLVLVLTGLANKFTEEKD